MDDISPSHDNLPPIEDTGPVSLSFPALLRNPGVNHRFAHLLPNERKQTSAPKKYRRDDNDGKRWVRRKENSKFAGNLHIVPASKNDYSLPIPYARSTFPEPLPAYLPRTAKAPSATAPAAQHASANAGRFSTSLKGMRKVLRRAGPRAQLLVLDVECEIIDWLIKGGTILAPGAETTFSFPGRVVGGTEVIEEVGRTPLQLVWHISDDAFARYVVHCCARYHEVVSFSKEIDGHRLTYLLRPNVTRPDRTSALALDTPPATDMDYSSQGYLSSDAISDRDGVDSDHSALSAIGEGSDAGDDFKNAPPVLEEEGWSIIGESDVDGDVEVDADGDSGSDLALSQDFSALALDPADADRTPRPARVLQAPLRHGNRVWDAQRSGSSPSRSPARRALRRNLMRKMDTKRKVSQPQSFHDYLFS